MTGQGTERRSHEFDSIYRIRISYQNCKEPHKLVISLLIRQKQLVQQLP